MASMIQVRVEDELKQQADMLFKDLGTDTTTAIRMFLKQAVCHDGFPFEIKRNSNYRNPYIPISEDEMQTACFKIFCKSFASTVCALTFILSPSPDTKFKKSAIFSSVGLS